MRRLVLAALASLLLGHVVHANPPAAKSSPSPSPPRSSSPRTPSRPAAPRVVVQVAPPGTVQVRSVVQSPTPTVRWVYYRSDVHVPWACYGGYHRPADAHAAANYFRSLGMDSFIR